MSRKTKALEARRLNMISAQSVSDDQATNMPGMYPEWNKDGVDYGDAEKGQPVIVRYDGLEMHISTYISGKLGAWKRTFFVGSMLRSCRRMARMETALRST